MEERRQDYPQILADLAVIKEKLNANEIDHKEIKDCMSAITTILNGNGKIGMVAKVENLVNGTKMAWVVISGVVVKLAYDWLKNISK